MKALKITKATGYEDMTNEEVTTFLFSKEEAMEWMRKEIERMFRVMENFDPHNWTDISILTITDDEEDN